MAPETPRASPQGGLHGGPIEPWASQRVPPSWLWAHWQRQGRTRRWAPAVSLSETRKVLSVRNSFLARCRALPPWPRHAEPGSRGPIPHFPKSPKATQVPTVSRSKPTAATWKETQAGPPAPPAPPTHTGTQLRAGEHARPLSPGEGARAPAGSPTAADFIRAVAAEGLAGGWVYRREKEPEHPPPPPPPRPRPPPREETGRGRRGGVERPELPQVRSNSDKSVSLNGGSAAREGAEGPDQRGRRDALGEAGPTGSGNGSFLGSLEVSVGASRVTLRERSARDPDPSRTRCSPLIRGKRASCSRRPVGERRVHNFGVRRPAGPARNRSGARGFSARRVWAASEILPDRLVFSPPRSHRKKSGNGNPAGATNPRNEARTKWIDGVNSCSYNRPGLHPEVRKKQQEQRLSSRKCTRSSLWQEHSVRL
uniref:Serine/threonine-protein kinase LMTK3-like n=1 Tax=Tursiops truncatus TaxID=9739 RepID=A0A6J3RT45_TURTR|nr:serine/threonine-protein kinase LMTK3-like [Tursiops truncatus]